MSSFKLRFISPEKKTDLSFLILDGELLVNIFKIDIQRKQVGLHQKVAIMAQDPEAKGNNVAMTATEAAHGAEDEYGSWLGEFGLLEYKDQLITAGFESNDIIRDFGSEAKWLDFVDSNITLSKPAHRAFFNRAYGSLQPQTSGMYVLCFCLFVLFVRLFFVFVLV